MMSLMSKKPTKSQKQLEENGSNLIIKDLFSVLGVDLNYIDSDGKAPLHQYAETNNLIMGALLLKGGADVNIKTKGYDPGKTPLHISVEREHVNFVKLLVECKANVNEQDDVYQKTALHFCAESANKDIFDILLAAGADVNLTDRNGKTALHVTVEYGREACYLRTTDADVELTEREGKIVDTLLDAGANVNMADKEGSTAIDCAFCPFNEILVKLLLKRGANINRKDVNGRTPLHHCAQNGGKDIIVYLLKAGASENIRDNEGKTPLHYSVQCRNNEAFQKLVKCKDILDTTDNNGLTALHYSVQYKNSVLTGTLLKVNATATIRDKKGRTALHYAAMFGYKQTVQTLLKYTDGLDTGDNFNQTALHYSVKRGHTEVAKTLLEAGAGVDVKDQYGKTPLHYINDSYASDIIEVLIQYGANLDVVDTSGQTALDVATMEEHYRVVKVLIQHGVKPSKENKEKMKATFNCSIFPEVKQTIGTTAIRSVDFCPEIDDTPTKGCNTTSIDTTPSTVTASATNVTSTACTTKADATDDTTTSTDTIPAIVTVAYTTSTPVESTNSTKQITSSIIISTNTTKATQLKHPHTQDMMVKREKTRIESIVQNKRIRRHMDNRKKIFDKLVRHHSSDDIKNPTKSMRNSSSDKKSKKGEYNLLRGGSTGSLESRTKYSRKRIRTSIYDMRHQSRMRVNSYRRKYFWKYKIYDKKRMKETNVKCTSLDLNHSTKPNTLEWSDIDYVNETKQTKTQILTQNEVSLPVQNVLNSVQWALSTEMTINYGNTVNTVVNLSINYTAIRDCNEVNIENVKYLTIDGKIGGKDG